MIRRYLYLTTCILFSIAAIMTLISREAIAEKMGIVVYVLFFIGVTWEIITHSKAK